MTKLETPHFKDESEEAVWWDTHEEEAFSILEQAAKNGTLTRGTLVRRSLEPTTSISLESTDVALAKAQAEIRGLEYRAYLKLILHEALLREAGAAKV